MPNEGVIRNSLQITINDSRGILQYQSNPTSFRANVTVCNGPTPGSKTVPVAGVNIDLTQLAKPGLCWIQNTDAVNSVEYGIFHAALNQFFPLGELLAGECYTLRLSKWFGRDLHGTGSGGTAGVTSLHFKASGGPVVVIVNAFDS